ncbi:MAG: hypothetical protein KC501_38305 [Myxococcales bacterium]|nr:hypothetical protein [Myxococcales bacterium]
MGSEPNPVPWPARLRKAEPGQRDAIVAQAPTGWREPLRALLEGPEPEEALTRAAGLPEPIQATPWPVRLSRLLHEGSYPARLLALYPEALAGLHPEAPPADPLAALRQAVGEASLDDALGRVRSTEYLRLAAREVEGAPLEETGGALSDLVAACLQVLLEQLQLAEQVVVFGMGKLGGHELNFLSDIDLVFVHDDAIGEGDVERRRELVDLHQRLRTLVRHLEGQGKWRPLFRVDLRLRPFGSRGPLSTSVTATEAYYERHGRAWERQVWLRGRPLAGRLDLGALLLRRLTPFVYRRSVGPEIFGEIADMMRRARREATRVGGDDGDVDIKLDTGGIREVEFTVQALQLLHGGRNPGVRDTGTLPALDRLLAAGLVSDREHHQLGVAYRWMRHVEHRVQLAEGQQTHRIPGEAAARARLARRLRVGGSAASLTSTMQRHRQQVRAIAKTIGGDEELGDPRAHDLAVALDDGAPRDDRCAALQRLGVHDPAETEARLEHLRTRPDGAFASTGTSRHGAENLLRACLDSADPDAAIARLVELAATRPAHYGIWRAFAEPSPVGRDLLRLTGELLGASEPLGRGLIGFPPGRPAGPGRSGSRPDFLLGLLERASEAELPGPRTLAADLRRQLVDPRGLDATLLHFKHEQLVRAGLFDLGRRPDPLVVGRAISDVADLVLRVILRDLAAEAGVGSRFDLAVLALGKHGMQAMDYGSDLDLMFVFEPLEASPEAQTAAARLAQRLMTRLESRALGQRLYEVDMRLRPSGRQGLLVTSLTGFRRYHARRIAVWERLALLRTRAIAEVRVGEPGLVPPSFDDLDDAEPDPPGAMVAAAVPGSLCEAIEDTVSETLGWRPGPEPPPSADEMRQQTRRLKQRIEAELARENRAQGRFNAKTGEGGCLELELLVAALQLVHGPEHPAARARGIVDAVEGLGEAGVLPRDEVAALCADYRFLRLLLNRLRMSPGGRGEDPDRFSENSPRLVTLARRMGFPSRADLMRRFSDARSRVRSAFDHHLPG